MSHFALMAGISIWRAMILGKPYFDSEAGVWVRAGAVVDPERVARARMNEWVDQNVFRTAAGQNAMKHERNWDYYKHGRNREFPKPDRRYKGAREVGTRG